MKPFSRLRKLPYVFALLILFACTIIFVSCSSRRAKAEKIESKVEIPKDDIEFGNKMSTVLEEYVKTLPSVNIDSAQNMSWQEVVKKIYEKNNYHALWVSRNVLTPKGKEMLTFLSTVEYLGLNKALYSYEKMQRIADSMEKAKPMMDYNLSKQLEVGLTRSFLQIALHVDHGMFLDTSRGLNTNFWKLDKKYTELLNNASTQRIDSIISTLEPNNPLYNRYMAALRDFVSKNDISSTPIHVRDPKLDSIGAIEDAKKALVYHHYLVDSLKNNKLEYLSALIKFQRDNNLNGDGNIGKNTIKALERDNSKKFELLAINADRWRKERLLKLPERYVWVNLPSFRVRIIEDDTLRLEKKVVIGKTTDRTETPILESAINQIILWPTWTVPQYIIKHEMKSFKGFIVTTVNGYTTVVQPPGPKNSLGSVKLLFPNKYSVYMHDTPAKSLFNTEVRAGSHGCVRCQDALELAANLMMMDTFQITYDSLKALRDEKIETRTFHLKKGIPLYFRYFTAEADFSGNLKFYADVYQRDKDMTDFIFYGKKPHVRTKRELAIADSLAAVKKKKNDSIANAKQLAVATVKPKLDSFVRKDSLQ